MVQKAKINLAPYFLIRGAAILSLASLFTIIILFQDQLRDLEIRLKKVSNDPTSYSEKKRLKDIIEDKNQQIDQLKRDEDSLKDQVSYYRREVSVKILFSYYIFMLVVPWLELTQNKTISIFS